MSKKIMQELKNMSIDMLQNQAEEIRKELFLLRMKKYSTPEKNISLNKERRKDLARTLVVLKQKEMHGNN